MTGVRPRVPRPGARIQLDHRTRLWRDARLVLGGSPWGVVRVAPAVAALVDELRQAGDAGLVPAAGTQARAAAALVGRGLAHPAPRSEGSAGPPRGEVDVVVPVLGRPDLLDACLTSLAGARVVVVDDGSVPEDAAALARVVRRHGARLLRHETNRGPAAARNTGLAQTRADVVAFVDADCRVPPGWLDGLLPLFDDPLVGAVAPRVVPTEASTGLLARHERARSALDMGPRRALVRPGAALGFVPSATLLVRREAVQGTGFDERLRLGEDVDLVWRLADAGWHVRYEPGVRVEHEPRPTWRSWAARRHAYGTSAADLERRHPGRLAPARISAWNVAALVALAAHRPGAAATVTATAAGWLGVRLRARGIDPRLGPVVVGAGLLADAAAVGHALRREWWPLGWAALAASPRSRTARLAAGCMLLPVALEWARHRPAVDPLRYLLLRLAEDAAYGSGVIDAAARGRTPAALLPRVRPLRGARRPEVEGSV